MTYQPATASFPCFAHCRDAFESGEDSPRAFLERGIAAINTREHDVAAFVELRLEAARREADASTLRWQNGNPLSPVDGMPFAVKDCFDVAGLPTRVNSAMFADAPAAPLDAAHVDALRGGGAVVVGKTVTT